MGQVKRKLPLPSAAKSSPPVPPTKKTKTEKPWRMTLASSSSASRPEPAGNAEQTSAMNTSEKEWYSSVNKKREEGHRSGWMNKMAILLVRVERGDSDHITELLKQFLDYSKMYFVFQLCFVVIFSESYDKSQKTGSGIAPKKEWLSSWKSLKKAWRETREWIEPEHIMMLTEQLFRIFKRLYCLQILQKNTTTWQHHD